MVGIMPSGHVEWKQQTEFKHWLSQFAFTSYFGKGMD